MATRPAKDWQDRPSVATPLDAAGMEDLEDRVFGYTEDAVEEHNQATADVHGVEDMSALVDQAAVDSTVATHSADTTSVHGIADTADLATSADLAGKENVGEIHGLDLPAPTASEDGQGFVYDHATGAWIYTAGSGYSDEQAQDAVGTILVDSSQIDFTYTDATPEITATIKSGAVSATEVAGSLKPSGSATGTDESLRRLGTGSTHAAAGDDSRFPSSGEKNALAGTSGTPGTGNEYATKQTTDALQPLDSDLTAIAALSTTSFGRALLALADAAALRTAADVYSTTASDAAYQPKDSDLTAIAALSTTSFGRSLLTQADAAATLSTIGAQAADTELSALAGLTSAADKGIQFTGSGTAGTYDLTTAGKALLDDADASAQRTTLSVYSKAETDINVAVVSNGAANAQANSGTYAPGTSHWTATATALTSNQFYAMRFVPIRAMTINSIIVVVTTLAGASTDQVELGICTAASGTSLALVRSTGSVNSGFNTTGRKSFNLTSSASLSPNTEYYAFFTATSTASLIQANFVGGFGSQMPGTTLTTGAEAMAKATTAPGVTFNLASVSTVTGNAPLLFLHE